jgi:hypothetical protein
MQPNSSHNQLEKKKAKTKGCHLPGSMVVMFVFVFLALEAAADR